MRILSEANRRHCGNLAAVSAAIARSRRFSRPSSPSRARCSSNCAPIVITGLSAVIGCCGMNAIARPRRARRRAGGICSRSSPSNNSDPRNDLKTGRKKLGNGTPDHRLSGAGLTDQTEDFAGRQIERKPADCRYDVAADLRANRNVSWPAKQTRCYRPPSAKSHVERTPQPVAQQIKGRHRQKDRDSRQQEIPRRLINVLPCIGDHLAPRRLVGADAQSDERKDGLDDDGDRHFDADERNQQRQRRRQYFTRRWPANG